LDDAVVLDPTGRWRLSTPGARLHFTSCTTLNQEGGTAVWTVTGPGGKAHWDRSLAMPISIRRYPTAVLTYRAAGIAPIKGRCVLLNTKSGNSVCLLRGFEVIADGEVHEVEADLRDAVEGTAVSGIDVWFHCEGPEPATFEMLGLRFESDHNLPPLEEGEGDEVTVRVVDLADRGIPGATVTLDGEWINAARSATTDDTGRATVVAAGSDLPGHTLRVSKEGMATFDSATDPDRPLPETVTLVRGARFGGVVRNEAGDPVAGVVVGLRMYTRDANGERSWPDRLLTDDAGHWQSTVLPAEPAACSLELYHPDYAEVSFYKPPLQALREGTSTLTIERGVVMRGIVLRPDGQPVSRAQVKRRMSESVWTDQQGRFAFPPWTGKGVPLVVEAPGFAPAVVNVEPAPDMPDVEIRLERASLILGRVVDVAGKPVPDAKVEIKSWGRVYSLSWSAGTDADGRFAWPDAPAGEVTFVISKRGYMTLKRVILSPADAEHEITLPPPLHITGTIRDRETGKPIADARLVPGSYGHPNNPSPSWTPRETRPCTDGRYEVTFDEYQGLLAFRIDAPGYASESVLKLTPGEAERTIDLTLQPAVDLTGIVYLPDGRPARGAQVLLAKEGGFAQFSDGTPHPSTFDGSCTTGEDGRYRLPATEGKWVLVAVHPVGYTESSTATYKESPDLKLEAWGRVEGTYRRGREAAAGESVSVYAQSRWRKPDGFSDYPSVFYTRSGKVDEKGHFLIDRIPPGKATVSAFGRQSEVMSVTVRSGYCEVPADGIAHVEFGGTGRPVVGRFSLPKEDEAAVDWSRSGAAVKTRLDLDIAKPDAPTEWDGLPLLERQSRFATWWRSEDGRKYTRALVSYRQTEQKYWRQNQGTCKRYGLLMAADGSFRGYDIPAGRYVLSLRLEPKPEGQERQPRRRLGVFEFEVTVPEMPGGRSDEPLDIGTLPIRGVGILY
jgi:hypothetical protein